MIRPERVELSKQPARDGWVFGRGTLRQTIFRGSGWRLYIELPEDQEIAIDTKEPSANLMEPGDEVHFGWPAERCRVLLQ